mgnify:CR=1 FL=1
MGARGPLKIVSPLRSVRESLAGSAAAEVPALAPRKPEAVASDVALSALWDEIVPELDRAGLVAPSDGPAVEMCLRHFLVARAAYEQVGAEVTVRDMGHGGVKKSPAEAVFRAQSEMFLKFAQQLGMTFVARARTPAAKGADNDGNPFTASV